MASPEFEQTSHQPLSAEESQFLGGSAVNERADEFAALVAGEDLTPGATEQERIEAAAVHTPANPAPPSSPNLRPGYWKKATPEQIAKAAEFGYDLQKNNDKYYT
jgi:hypothetical protein